MTESIFWIVAAVAFAVVEIATSGLVSIWFAGGSIVSLVAALLGAPVWLQIVLFIVVSAVLIILLKNFATEYFKSKNSDTNLDRIVGKEVTITETVDKVNNTGRALINDVEWKVASKNGEIIEKGEVCTVDKIEGVKLVVTK